jgi:hypothetical protein
MTLQEKSFLFILSEISGKPFKGISKYDIEEEYDYALKDLQRDGYIEKRSDALPEAVSLSEKFKIIERGKMKLRLLREKWDEERN